MRTEDRIERTTPRGQRTAAGLLTLLVLGLSASGGCSVLVDSDADQCSVDADCTARGDAFAGSRCEAGLCVGAGVTGCTTNQECIGALGNYHVCNKATATCVSLLSAECTTVEGDYANDAAFIFGSILPTQGADAPTGRPIENSIRLAISDFETASNGLPPVGPGAPTRPIVLVGCNDASDTDTAVVAARHLVDDVGVPAIVGAAFSGITIKVATEVAIPAGVLMISPSATSVAITSLVDGGLVWRTSPSDVFQASALAGYVPLVEQEVRTDLGLTAGESIKLAILHKGDAYGTGLGGALEKVLQLNGKAALDGTNQDSYLRFDYGNPDDPTVNPTKYSEAVAQALELAPHVILVFGTNEGVVDIFEAIEQQWDAIQPPPAYRPRFLFSDGGLINDLWDYVGSNDALRKRVGGTVPGTDNILFKSFRSQYTTKFTDGTSPDVFGAAGGYDAAYLLAYAAVTLGKTPITGAGLAAGLGQMIDGASVDVGSSGINDALAPLLAGSAIDFNGASGPLNFDLATGEAPSDIQIWCLPKDAAGKAQSGTPSGQFYNAASGALEGTVGTACQ